MILSAIDIGTNTLRLLIAETSADTIREIHSDRRITRLGQDLEKTSSLSAAAWHRSLAALEAFAVNVSQFGAEHVAAVGTSALRNASNAAEYVKTVRETTGIAIQVISGEEEARLTMLGVSKAVHIRDTPALVVDIGGGSTEIILSEPDGTVREISLPLGAVYLTERLFKSDPTASEEVEQARQVIRREIGRHGWLERAPARAVLVGTAGTVTTLAAMDLNLRHYDPARINGITLKRETVEKLVSVLKDSAVKERRNLPGLEPGREDIILAGAVVCEEIMKWFAFEKMLVSDWGLREGILFDLYDRIRKKTTRRSE